jgi:polyisoprenoid-binding protein YceI
MHLIRSAALLTAVTASLMAFSVTADAAIHNARESEVVFHATGPAGLKIEGKTKDLKVNEEGGKILFVVPLAGVDTGISLRNKHMTEKYLEVAKFPAAKLTVERSALRLPEEGKESAGKAPGTMEIHGVSKPVEVTYKARRAGSGYNVEGSVKLSIKAFGIEIPSYMGVTVKDDVEVDLKAKVED